MSFCLIILIKSYNNQSVSYSIKNNLDFELEAINKDIFLYIELKAHQE